MSWLLLALGHPSPQQSVLHTFLEEAGSDKAGHHGYTRFYDPLFEPLRTYPTRLVEIGVEEGKSMRAWQKYFSNNQSHVFDWLRKLANGARYQVRRCASDQDGGDGRPRPTV